jgi:hypothetical protein
MNEVTAGTYPLPLRTPPQLPTGLSDENQIKDLKTKHRTQDYERTKEKLVILWDALKKISKVTSENGINVKQPKPSQYIYREVRSILTVRSYFDGNQDIKHWSPFDILGNIMSWLGMAPPSATLYNFFIPLTAVFAMWCSKIAPDLPLPTTYCVTWDQQPTSDSLLNFRLGANLGGYDGRASLDWTYRLKRARYEILSPRLKLPGKDPFKDAPELGKGRGPGWSYGQCAETYPFVYMFEPHSAEANKTIHGIALKWDFIDREYFAEMPNPAQFHSRDNSLNMLKGLCRNCSEVVHSNKGERSNFRTQQPPKG